MSRGPDPPIACSLSGPGFARRREEVSGLLHRSTRTVELDDGYECDGSAETARQLAGSITTERARCPFLRLEFVFEPGEGRILSRVRGPEGTGEFVRRALLAGPA